MKKIFFFLVLFIFVALACDLNLSVTPSTEVPTAETTPVLIDPPTITPEVFISLTQAIPATEIPRETPVFQPSPVMGTVVTYGRLTLEIPAGVANGASGMDMPPVTHEDSPYWEKTPGHLQVSLNDYYVLQGKFHKAQIYVYPALEYATLVPGAFESMHRLRNMLSAVVPITPDQLPAVPFFNAAQVFASNIQTVTFQNGEGIRFLTEYAQYAAPVNNHELFYHFEGFSDDGVYYIIVIFPITVPVLADTSDPGAVLPARGIPFPDINDPEADYQSYYTAITNLLNTTSPDAFYPAITQLDLLIQSMQIAP